jgi:hypothetical protein
MHWKDEVSHGDLARWMAGFGIDRLYVGHCASEHAEVHFSGRVILVDATLSSWYESGHDGAIIIVDPASELPAVLISDPKGIGLVTVPFHVGYSREMLLNNEIGRYADEVYGSVK